MPAPRCDVCDDTGWVCEGCSLDAVHVPWDGCSSRADACGCGPGAPCVCNPDGGIDRASIMVTHSVDGKNDLN